MRSPGITIGIVCVGMARERQHQREHEQQQHDPDDDQVRQRDLDESPVEVRCRRVHGSPLSLFVARRTDGYAQLAPALSIRTCDSRRRYAAAQSWRATAGWTGDARRGSIALLTRQPWTMFSVYSRRQRPSRGAENL